MLAGILIMGAAMGLGAVAVAASGRRSRGSLGARPPTVPEKAAEILALKRANPTWGPRTISRVTGVAKSTVANIIERGGPSRSAIVQRGAIQERLSRARRPDDVADDDALWVKLETPGGHIIGSCMLQRHRSTVHRWSAGPRPEERRFGAFKTGAYVEDRETGMRFFVDEPESAAPGPEMVPVLPEESGDQRWLPASRLRRLPHPR